MHNAKGNINKPNEQWRADPVAPGAARKGALVFLLGGSLRLRIFDS